MLQLATKNPSFICVALSFFAVFTAPKPTNAAATEPVPKELREPGSVVGAYLRAVYARDFAEAYRYVSSADRRTKDLTRYLRQRGPLSGFALQAAKTLAAMMQIEITGTESGEQGLLLTVRYHAPDPRKLAPLLHGWNGYRLNTLSVGEREQIIEAIRNKQRDQTLETIAGAEKLTLIQENDGWRIFLNWAAGVTIPFRTIFPDPATAAALEVRLSRQELVLEPGDLFEIVLTVKNRSTQPVIARIGHIVQPSELSDYLEFVQCGFLAPISLQPGAEQEYSGTYLLRGSLPEGIRELGLTYDFKIAEGVESK